MFSTSGDVQYIGGCSVHRRVFSTSGGYHEYIGGGGYHEYIGGCSVHRGDIMSTSGDIISTSGRYHEYIGGYHKYTGGFQYIGGIP